MQKSMIKLVSVADFITLVNAVFGFLAIITASIGEMRFSLSFILLAVLADGLDGIVARKTGKGNLGDYLESMADMTSLGISPAFFIYITYYDFASKCIYYHTGLFIVLILFLSLSIIRLSSFHIMKMDDFFVGLPASAGTIIILILAFLKIEYLYILPVVVVVSFAMVTNVHFPKMEFKTNVVATVLIFLTLIMWDLYNNIAPLILLIAIVIYALIGPLYLLVRKK